MSSSSSMRLIVARELGKRLRQLREDAGVSKAAVVADRVASERTLERYESGQGALKPGTVSELCNFYRANAPDKVPKAVVDELTQLARAMSQDGAWDETRRLIPNWFGLYLALEGSCKVLASYDPETIHGVLQTDAYARAVVAVDGSDEKRIEGVLRLRGERRKALLDRPDATLRVVLGQAALSLKVGSEEVMRGQIKHMRALNQRSNVDISVIPWQAGAHPGMKSGAFTILEFYDPQDPDVVYLESLTGARYVDRAEQVRAYVEHFRSLRQRAVPIEEIS